MVYQANNHKETSNTELERDMSHDELLQKSRPRVGAQGQIRNSFEGL